MKKIPFTHAHMVLKRMDLEPKELEKIDIEISPQALVEQWFNEKSYILLAQFYAHALPMREGLWWGKLALDVRKSVWTDKENALLGACEHWVRDPNEGLRRQIEAQLDKLENDRAVRWLGQAVFWSGVGSIAPIDNPVVMPDESLYCKALAGAVNTAAAIPEWDKFDSYYRSIFAIAKDIADGGSGVIKEGVL
ncbi:hypothetical protein [Vibrio sp. SCSIO 43136]|uniref:DUF6931 family protein n=1 Tax=Vibrio sp. SCSIO 43136 TaxID=2819101 RepID=UPI002075D9F5|nr:hypothetical protein [Vibrio sp. SCSIO 43136]